MSTRGSGGGGGDRCLSTDINLVATAVSGTLSVNGVAVTDRTQGAGAILLVDASGGFAQIASIPAQGGSYLASVVPGTYDLYYGLGSGTALPTNGSAKFKSGIVVGTSPVTLDIDVPATMVSGTLTLNGAAIPDGANMGTGRLELRSATRDRALLASTSAPGGSFSTLVVPGTYDLYYYSLSGEYGAPLPANTSAKLQSGIVVGASPVFLKIDIPATSVSVAVTVRGAALTGINSNTLASFLTLKNDTGDKVVLAVKSTAGLSSAPVIPGTYDLYISPYGDGPDIPKNPLAKVHSAIIVGSSALSLTFDVPVTTLSGKLTVNGATISALSGPMVLKLSDAVDDVVDLSPDAAGSYSCVVVPGTYDLAYTNQRTIADGVPRNSPGKIKDGIVVDGPAKTLDIDIPATTVSGTVTVNGAMLTSSRAVDGEGFIYLANGRGDFAGLSNLHPGSFSVSVVPGTYDLRYQSTVPGPGVPINYDAVLRKGIVVGASPVTLDTDIRAVTVSGTIRVNGQPVPNQPKLGVSRLYLYSPEEGGGALALIPPQPTDPAAVPPGAYSALVILGSYVLKYEIYTNTSPSEPLVPSNQSVDLGCFNVP